MHYYNPFLKEKNLTVLITPYMRSNMNPKRRNEIELLLVDRVVLMVQLMVKHFIFSSHHSNNSIVENNTSDQKFPNNDEQKLLNRQDFKTHNYFIY